MKAGNVDWNADGTYSNTYAGQALLGHEYVAWLQSVGSVTIPAFAAPITQMAGLSAGNDGGFIVNYRGPVTTLGHSQGSVIQQTIDSIQSVAGSRSKLMIIANRADIYLQRQNKGITSEAYYTQFIEELESKGVTNFDEILPLLNKSTQLQVAKEAYDILISAGFNSNEWKLLDNMIVYAPSYWNGKYMIKTTIDEQMLIFMASQRATLSSL